MPQTLTAKDLLVTEGILTCLPSNTLAQAFAKLNSSHDAVFVVDEKNELLGVISPYYVMFQTKFPPTTKVRNCLFHPPKLNFSTPIWEIARQMVQAKIYFLPVFADNGKWEGIVSVYRIMQAVTEDPQIEKELADRKRSTRIITIRNDAEISEARALLGNGGVSRLPVVDENGKLVGILTRYDLREAFAAPLSSPNLFSRQGEKRKRFSEPIRNYYKQQVVTATHKTPLAQMINTMLSQQIGSILTVNEKWQPVSILSYRDILEAISDLRGERKEAVTLSAPDDFEHKLETLDILEKFVRKLQERGQGEWMEATIEVIRNAAETVKRFEVTLKTHHAKAGSYIAKAGAFKWNEAVRDAIEKIERQASRNN
ncbi:MAG: hypothetical protein A2785_00795 [Candidatus Chisholmbacteria bacterium RIFCSPHIGHO2_01_FULL_49_18]|uniref:CBS domain-containing protein n=2 Tax=Candidatus Chisholmiibacteriota TaxID=1817900 RepID=A0A1G1VL25_9BACT|nr:MAG: hypothetical protein A2785_00795 [Candidatus Chisholmbacteria bacterium RIFCSPHIGHO2_01_FULL_49_18]OGY22207.1 MAG: hypothetical protein A3A65_04925 [Candidatus Chisholmbacteria bacterium RIFCSPLOWO2_01_FULL_49_14]